MHDTSANLVGMKASIRLLCTSEHVCRSMSVPGYASPRATYPQNYGCRCYCTSLQREEKRRNPTYSFLRPAKKGSVGPHPTAAVVLTAGCTLGIPDMLTCISKEISPYYGISHRFIFHAFHPSYAFSSPLISLWLLLLK